MKLVFLFGDAAVGKMTVGQELMQRTDLRLFHNHMTIEPVLEVFGRFEGRTINRLRQVIFEEFAASDCYGMIFTYMWAFDCQSVSRTGIISSMSKGFLPVRSFTTWSWWRPRRSVWSAIKRRTG